MDYQRPDTQLVRKSFFVGPVHLVKRSDLLRLVLLFAASNARENQDCCYVDQEDKEDEAEENNAHLLTELHVGGVLCKTKHSAQSERTPG